MLVPLPAGDVVSEEHLVVIVGALRVAIYSVGHVEQVLAVLLTRCRGEGDAVDARASEAVFHLATAVADAGAVVSKRFLNIYGSHDVGGIHVLACEAVQVEDGDVEAVLL